MYILTSKEQDWQYIGYSGDLSERFKDHNARKVKSTNHYAPINITLMKRFKRSKKQVSWKKYFLESFGTSHRNSLFEGSTAEEGGMLFADQFLS